VAGLLNYSSTPKMEAIRSSETSGTTLRTTRRHVPEDDTLQNHRCENLKSYFFRLNCSFKDFSISLAETSGLSLEIKRPLDLACLGTVGKRAVLRTPISG
jgi:hypothetical protein